MNDPLYQNSLCAGGWLHNYKIARDYTHTVKEICEKCKDVQYFKSKTPNRVYLSYHIRESLQPNRKIFNHEYR